MLYDDSCESWPVCGVSGSGTKICSWCMSWLFESLPCGEMPCSACSGRGWVLPQLSGWGYGLGRRWGGVLGAEEG